MIPFFMEGYSRKRNAEILHIPHQTVCVHIASYQKGGMDALLLFKQTGIPRKLSEEQEHTLVHIISTQTPEEAGMGIFPNWTSYLVCNLTEERFGVAFNDRGMRNLFDCVGLSYTRPTDTLEKAKPEKQKPFRKDFEILKKLLNHTTARLLFEDEFMIRDYQAIMKTWFLKGKQRIIPTFGKYEGVKLVCYLDYETGRVYVEEHKKYDAETFLHFLKNVLKPYPDGKTGMILDNVRIHHAMLLQSFLEENREYLELVFLSLYSLNQNKIEELWGWMKDSVINNVFFHSRQEIRAAVQKFVNWVNTVPQEVIDRLCL